MSVRAGKTDMFVPVDWNQYFDSKKDICIESRKATFRYQFDLQSKQLEKCTFSCLTTSSRSYQGVFCGDFWSCFFLLAWRRLHWPDMGFGNITLEIEVSLNL